jgi:DNA (cytosine-5)-methyltransferase 1
MAMPNSGKIMTPSKYRRKRTEGVGAKMRPSDLTKSCSVKEEPTIHNASRNWTSVDLFCGAGGITEGFSRAGFECLYANDINHWAIQTFRANHPTTLADNRPIEEVDARALRRELGIKKGELDVLVGGPPCQGFSINAPERFLDDPRNSLFRDYIRFLDEFEPKALLFENIPRMFMLCET